MPLNQNQALQLVENPAFDAVFDEFESDCFRLWLSTESWEERERLYAKAQVAREVKQALKNKAVDNGIHGRAANN